MHRLAMVVGVLVAGAVLPPTLAGAAPAAASGVSVTISSNCTGFCFAPAQMTIAAGDTVTWVNHSGAVHDVTRCSPARCNGESGGTGTDPSFTAGKVAAASGATFRHTFTEPGTYVYYCTLHGYALMHGTITVTAPAPTTTVTTATPTAVLPPTTASASAPRPTTPPAPQLANTGSGANRDATVAVVLIAAGLCATRFRRRPRSQSVR